jgi:hypothetical protein
VVIGRREICVFYDLTSVCLRYFVYVVMLRSMDPQEGRSGAGTHKTGLKLAPVYYLAPNAEAYVDSSANMPRPRSPRFRTSPGCCLGFMRDKHGRTCPVDCNCFRRWQYVPGVPRGCLLCLTLWVAFVTVRPSGLTTFGITVSDMRTGFGSDGVRAFSSPRFSLVIQEPCCL